MEVMHTLAKLQIVPATPEQAATFCEIRAGNWRAHYPRNLTEEKWMDRRAAIFCGPLGVSKLAKCLKSARDDPASPYRALAALADSEVAGYGVASFEPSEWVGGVGDVQEVSALHVMNRSQGCGSAVLGTLLGLMDPTRRVALYTPAHATPAIRFYERWGFEASEVRPPDWGPMEGVILIREPSQ